MSVAKQNSKQARKTTVQKDSTTQKAWKKKSDLKLSRKAKDIRMKNSWKLCSFAHQKVLGTLGVTSDQQPEGGKIDASQTMLIMNKMSDLIESLQLKPKEVASQEKKKVCLSAASSGSMLLADDCEPTGTEHQMKEIIDISNTSELTSLRKSDKQTP